MNIRDLEIHRLKNEEKRSDTELAKIFDITNVRISEICKMVERAKKLRGNSYLLWELSSGIVTVLMKKFGSASNVTIEKVAGLDPIELKRCKNVGQKSLTQAKDVLLKYKVSRMMHKNWKTI